MGWRTWVTLAVRTGRAVRWNSRQAGSHSRPQAADQPPGHALQIADRLLVIHLVDRHRQHVPPVIHQRRYCSNRAGDVAGIVGPADAAEVGHPARDGHVAQVAAAVDERRMRKQDREQAEIQVIVRHLVHDPRRGRRRSRSPLEVLLGQPSHRGRSSQGTQSDRRTEPPHHGRDRPRTTAGPAAARRRRGSASGSPGPARSASCPTAAGRRRRPVGACPGPRRQTGEEVAIERPDQAVDEAFVLGGRIIRRRARARGSGRWPGQAVGGARVIAARVEHVGQPEEQPASRLGQLRIGQPCLERGEVRVGQLPPAASPDARGRGKLGCAERGPEAASASVHSPGARGATQVQRGCARDAAPSAVRYARGPPSRRPFVLKGPAQRHVRPRRVPVSSARTRSQQGIDAGLVPLVAQLGQPFPESALVRLQLDGLHAARARPRRDGPRSARSGRYGRWPARGWRRAARPRHAGGPGLVEPIDARSTLPRLSCSSAGPAPAAPLPGVRQRLLGQAACHQHLAEVRSRGGVSRLELDGAAEVLQRLVELPQLAERQAQVVVGDDEARSQRDGPPERLDRLGMSFQRGQRGPHAAQCLGVIRPEPQRRARPLSTARS